jgi:hypothetical protein
MKTALYIFLLLGILLSYDANAHGVINENVSDIITNNQLTILNIGTKHQMMDCIGDCCECCEECDCGCSSPHFAETSSPIHINSYVRFPIVIIKYITVIHDHKSSPPHRPPIVI